MVSADGAVDEPFLGLDGVVQDDQRPLACVLFSEFAPITSDKQSDRPVLVLEQGSAPPSLALRPLAWGFADILLALTLPFLIFFLFLVLFSQALPQKESCAVDSPSFELV